MTEEGSAASESASSVAVQVSSFGFKYGLPGEAGWVIDVRMVRNPFWVDELRPYTGLEAPVRDYVLGDPIAVELVDRVRALLVWSAQQYADRSRDSLHVAVGCTGGRHRSVAVAEALAAGLRDAGLDVTVEHRDVDMPDPRW